MELPSVLYRSDGTEYAFRNHMAENLWFRSHGYFRIAEDGDVLEGIGSCDILVLKPLCFDGLLCCFLVRIAFASRCSMRLATNNYKQVSVRPGFPVRRGEFASRAVGGGHGSGGPEDLPGDAFG